MEQGHRHLSVDRTSCVLAGLHAAFTGFSTDPAVLMMGRMTPTLVATLAASCGAHI
jgi:hypothetical protein